MTLSAWIRPAAIQSGWRTILQREADAYFLNAGNSDGPLRPSGGGTLGGNTQYLSGPTASPGQRLDLRGPHLRRRQPAALHQRHPGRHPRGERRHPDHQQPALDRRQQPLRRVLPGADRRGPRLQPGAHPSRRPGGHEHRHRAHAPPTRRRRGAHRADAPRPPAAPRSTSTGPPRPTTSASPATASSAARARAAPTSPRWARRRRPPTATPACAPSTTYRYRVRAVDAAGNLGAVLHDRHGDHAGGARHDPAVGADRADAPRRSSTTQINLELDRLDRQRRRHRLPRRALPGHELHQLRPGGDADRHHVQRHRPARPRPPTATRCGRSTRPAT